MVKVYIRPMRQAILKRAAERTVSCTEQASGIVDVHQEVVGASFTQHFLCAVPREFLRCAVPVGDPALPVGDIDAVRQAVYDVFKRRFNFVGGRRRKNGDWGVHRFFLPHPAR
jgi:hypothetical protein